MNNLFLIFFVRACLSFDLPQDSCKPNLTIHDSQYKAVDTYQVGDTYPTDACYDEYGNLFYVSSERNGDGYNFDVKVIKADTSQPQKIPGLPVGESFSVAVSKKDFKVFFGTSDGVFQYNYNTSDATIISNLRLNLNIILVDNDGNKYITASPDAADELHLRAGDKKFKFISLESFSEIAVDDDNNFYFIKDEKLFVLKTDSSKPMFIANVSYEDYGQITFYEQLVFVASETLSYIHENNTGPLKLIKDIPGKVTAIAFDREGNFILGVYGKIIRYMINDECYHRNNLF